MADNPSTLPKSALGVEALLKLSDKAFVTSAYHTILGRSPDQGGLENYLAQVRAGVDKAKILAALAQSPEGRVKSGEPSELRKALTQYRKRAPSLLTRLYRRLAGTDIERIEHQLRANDNRVCLVECNLAQQAVQLGDLLTLALQMLANSERGSPFHRTSENQDEVGPSHVSNVTPDLARTFIELKAAIAIKRPN